MPDLNSVVLHLALCRAAVAASENAQTIPIHAVVSYERGQPFIDKVVEAPTGSNDDATVELELPRGQEIIRLANVASGCKTTDFVTVLPNHGRRIEETLAVGGDSKPPPMFSMAGEASLSFLATTRPTLVAFPTGLACNAPAPQTLPVDVAVTYDGGAYYLSIDDDQALAAQAPVLALSLHTASGKPHYIRLPMKPDTLGRGYTEITMNVTDDMVDGVATEQQNVLLCPQIWETSVL